MCETVFTSGKFFVLAELESKEPGKDFVGFSEIVISDCT